MFCFFNFVFWSPKSDATPVPTEKLVGGWFCRFNWKWVETHFWAVRAKIKWVEQIRSIHAVASFMPWLWMLPENIYFRVQYMPNEIYAASKYTFHFKIYVKLGGWFRRFNWKWAATLFWASVPKLFGRSHVFWLCRCQNQVSGANKVRGQASDKL